MGGIVSIIVFLVLIYILANKDKKNNINPYNLSREDKNENDYYYKNEEPEDDVSQKEIHKHDGWNNNDNPIKYNKL